MQRTIVLIISFALITITFSGCLGSETDRGFSEKDLVIPDSYIVDREDPLLPEPLSPVPYVYQYTLKWNVTRTIYRGYGGVLDLFMTNEGESTVFVYRFGVKWVNSTVSNSKNTSVYVEPDETEELGVLYFRAPAEVDSGIYEVHLWICVSDLSGTYWHDYGEVVTGYQKVSLSPGVMPGNYTVRWNTDPYYNRVNSLVSYEDASVVAETITDGIPIKESINSIVASFEWVRKNIAYRTDENHDHWQSVNETLVKGSGDCEDQAILLVSIYGALGLNGRVVIIEGHAFAAVYVSGDVSRLPLINRTIESIYWTELPVCYLHDSAGYWLVTDTTGFMYCGGLPAESAPVQGGEPDEWTFMDTDYVIFIDATGKTSGSSFWPFSWQLFTPSR